MWYYQMLPWRSLPVRQWRWVLQGTLHERIRGLVFHNKTKYINLVKLVLIVDLTEYSMLYRVKVQCIYLQNNLLSYIYSLIYVLSLERQLSWGWCWDIIIIGRVLGYNYHREGAGMQFIGLTPPHFNAVDILRSLVFLVIIIYECLKHVTWYIANC